MAAPNNIPLPPKLPERPRLFNEVEWGPFPTDDDIKLAYSVWSTQDGCLRGFLFRDGEPVSDDYCSPHTCLVRNVYESVMRISQLPLKEQQHDPFAQCWAFETGSNSINSEGRDILIPQRCTFGELFGTEGMPGYTGPPTRIRVSGLDTMSSRWTISKLREELRIRRQNTEGTLEELKARLHTHELDEIRRRALDVDKGSRFRMQSLPEWGIVREDDFLLKISTRSRFTPLDLYTWVICLVPYNPAYWTSRAYLYYQMGHFDLALGDVYRAQLLCDVLINPLIRNAQPGLYARIWHAIESHILQIEDPIMPIAPEIELLRDSAGVNAFIPYVRKSIHHITCLSLLALQCWADYKSFEQNLTDRLVMRDRDNFEIERRQKLLGDFVSKVLAEKLADPREYFYEGHYGYVSGKLPPFCIPIERTSKEVLDRINKELIGNSQATRINPPKIEVRETSPGRLGVFATESIASGETIYADEPSIRGHLRDFVDRDEHRCENCMRKYDPRVWNLKKANRNEAKRVGLACDCAWKPEPTYWCAYDDRCDNKESSSSSESSSTDSTGRDSRKRRLGAGRKKGEGEPEAKKRKKIILPSCLQIAKNQYHYRVCGRDWTWLHDAMRPAMGDHFYEPGQEKFIHHSNERHGTLLSLMLREVFDITLARREMEGKPNLLAYEIDELLPLMGADEDLAKEKFPFSYAANISVPFDILQCLGVNIFRDLTFDTWVIQLVLRKLLINAIPWDPERRINDLVDEPESKELRQTGLHRLPEERFQEAAPTFHHLYIFPGVSMFNHNCTDLDNVTSDWDLSVPNRILLRATRNIEADEELRLAYTPFKLEEDAAERLFGTHCRCRRCHWRKVPRKVHRLIQHYGDDTSSDDSEQPVDRCKNGEPPRTFEDGGDGEILGNEDSDSDAFAPEQAISPRPEDEGEFDEADFKERTPEVKEHSGVPFSRRDVDWHSGKLRKALDEARKKLPKNRRGTTETESG